MGIHNFSGQPLQCLTNLTIKKKKKIFLIFNVNLQSLSLKPLPLVLSLETLAKHLSPPVLQTPTTRSPQSLLFSRLNNPNFLSLSSQERCSRLLEVFADTGLQVGSHERGVEGENHLP